MVIKNVKHVELNISIATVECTLEYTNFRDDLIEHKCLYSKKIINTSLMKTWKNYFFNTYKFCNHDNNEFILLLRKCVFPYDYTDDWENFNETLPEKGDFYNHLNMEDITDADYEYAKRVCKDFESKSFGEYHDWIYKVIHFCQQMYLRPSERCFLRYTDLILENFFRLLD